MAQTRTDGKKKVLVLKPKYRDGGITVSAPISPSSIHHRSSVEIPVSPLNYGEVPSPPRQPPPYRPPPPPTPSHTNHFDNVSISSSNISFSELSTPQIPPRRKSVEKARHSEDASHRLINEYFDETHKLQNEETGRHDNNEKQTMSVKERTQKFNKMASVEDERGCNVKQHKEKNSLQKVSVL